jgi:hypothetical protein
MKKNKGTPVVWFDLDPPPVLEGETKYWYSKKDYRFVNEGMLLAKAFLDGTMTPMAVHDKLVGLMKNAGIKHVCAGICSPIINCLMEQCGKDTFILDTDTSADTYRDMPIITEPTRID